MKWIHSACGGGNGSPAVMPRTVAPRTVGTKVARRHDRAIDEAPDDLPPGGIDS
ncbi:hypothetical protein [Streptomyces sp. NPDC056361]|uniref:hypothetical protein n=1 Tax=Streptomyces sp. NPDC056361 TaxID=3345795 RepID=UPI0035D8DCF8